MFMRMVSNPGQFPYCPWMVPNPGQFHYCPWMVSNPRLMFFLRMVSNPGHSTRIARGFVRYKDEKGTFISDPK